MDLNTDTHCERTKEPNDDPRMNRTRELLKNLQEAIDSIKSGEEFQRYLRAMALFHKYSYCNVALILSQCPTATKVAGFRTWNRLGRRIVKGQKGLAIFIPWRVKRRDVETEEEDEYVTVFRIGYVWDIQQTTGDDLPVLEQKPIKDTHKELLPKLIQFAEGKGITVKFEHLPNCEGISKMGEVIIQAEKNATSRAAILVHELAHEISTPTLEERKELSTEVKEEIAEGVAFVVCTGLGLPDIGSGKYLALYQRKHKLGELLEVIHKVSQEILNFIEPPDRPEQV